LTDFLISAFKIIINLRLSKDKLEKGVRFQNFLKKSKALVDESKKLEGHKNIIKIIK
jgi:hypothetical protein